MGEGVVLAEICLDVADVAVDVLVAAVDAVQLLLEILIDEFIAVEQLIEAVHGRPAHVITVTIHII